MFKSLHFLNEKLRCIPTFYITFVIVVLEYFEEISKLFNVLTYDFIYSCHSLYTATI